MWRAEADPALRSTMVAFALLDQAPDWPRLVAAHDWATRMVPRFRDRVVEPPLGLGTPVWAPDPDFDLSRHLHRFSLAEGDGWPRAARRRRAPRRVTPFDRHRPPWEALLIEGLPDGKAAYLLKLHHATTDGHGQRRAVLGAAQPPGARPTRTSRSRRRRTGRGPGPGPWSALGRQVRHDAEALASVPTHILRAAGAALRDPIAKARDAVAFGLSAIRVIGDPGAAASPLLATRGPDWRFVALDLPFAPLRAAAKAAGGSRQRRLRRRPARRVPALPRGPGRHRSRRSGWRSRSRVRARRRRQRRQQDRLAAPRGPDRREGPGGPDGEGGRRRRAGPRGTGGGRRRARCRRCSRACRAR